MSGTPTAWAGFPLPAEGDLPDVPTDLHAALVAVDTALKMLMTSGTSSATAMPTPAPTGGANLLNVGPSITTLQATQSTQAGLITTAQTNIAALQTLTAPLNNAPNAFSYYNSAPPTITVAAGGGAVRTAVATYAIPTAAFQRMLICTVTANYAYANNATQAIAFFSNIVIGGTNHEMLRYSAASSSDLPSQHFNADFLITIPAATTATVDIEVLPYLSPTTATTCRTAETVPMIRGVLLPWSTGPALPFPF